MTEISCSELRIRLAEALRTAEGGEPVVITRHGKPAAALIAADHLARPSPPAAGGDRVDAAATERDAGGEPATGPGAGTDQPTPEELLERAAAPSLRRIELDLGRLPDKLKPVLAMIRENLFQPRLTVERIKRVLGLGANDLTTRFHAAAGAPIGRYLDDRRMECACRLLTDTELDVETIALLVGHRSKEVFARAFGRRHGVRPPVYREFGGRLSQEALDAVQTGRAPVVPRYVAGLSALASRVPCARCGDGLEPGAAMRVFEDLAPICDACARQRAPELVALVEAAGAA